MLSKSLYPSSLYIHTHSSLPCCDYEIYIEGFFYFLWCSNWSGGAVGGPTPGRCGEVGHELPEPLMSGSLMCTSQEEAESSFMSACFCSPWMVSSDSHLHVLFFLLTAATDEAKIAARWRGRADSIPPGGVGGGCSEVEPLACLPVERHFHHQSAICRLGGAGQLVLWIRPP